ncbi:MAG: hypothetical protein ACN4G0_16255 [Polyangiales bacterium]
MDLTRLYNLTTPELREEAERQGVTDTYAMSRGQLIHAIRNRAGGEQPEGFFGKVLGFAKWAIQAAQEEPRRETGGRPAKSETPAEEAAPALGAKRFERPAEPPMPALGNHGGSTELSGPVAESEPMAELEPAPEPPSTSEPAPEPGLEAAESPMPSPEGEEGSEPPVSSASGPPSRPPVGVFSKSASIFDEPFPTLTMARILAEQGHFKRALAIYATLLREGPGDAELSAEVDDVRARSRARRPQVQ